MSQPKSLVPRSCLSELAKSDKTLLFICSLSAEYDGPIRSFIYYALEEYLKEKGGFFLLYMRRTVSLPKKMML